MTVRESPARLRYLVAAALIALAAAASGCSSDDDVRLAGTWEPDKVPSVQFGPTFDPASAQITFDKGGEWTASDGCNDLSGTYSLDGDGGFSSEGDSVAGIGCGGGQIPYDLLLAQTDHVTIEDDGTASFESSKDERLLTLSPAS